MIGTPQVEKIRSGNKTTWGVWLPCQGELEAKTVHAALLDFTAQLKQHLDSLNQPPPLEGRIILP